MPLVHVSSFSYHYQGGPPMDAVRRGGFVFDCRCLPNPGRLEEYKALTGVERPVAAYLEAQASVTEFLAAISNLLRVVIASASPAHDRFVVMFGCTGGQHRSVYCAEWLAQHLREQGVAAGPHSRIDRDTTAASRI